MTRRYRHGIVHGVSRVARRAIRLLALAVTVVAVPAAASAQALLADFNGDGIHDRVEPGVRPTEVVVRLSSGHRQRHLQADSPIIKLTAIDFNRDGHLDLVATTRPGGLTVWINRGNGHFFRHRAGHPAPDQLQYARTAASRTHRRQPQGDNSDDVASRPLPLNPDTRVIHEFSYVRHTRDGRVVHIRFQSRSLVPRGPPPSQLF